MLGISSAISSTDSDRAAWFTVFAVAISVFLIFILLSFPLAPLFDKRRGQKEMYQMMMIFSNLGYIMATSKTIHIATSGGKVGNTKSISLKKSSVSLKVKKTYTIKFTTKAYSNKLKVKKHRAVLFESSNPKVATVSSKGVIKALKKGTCYVYAYAQDGMYDKIKVSVR